MLSVKETKNEFDYQLTVVQFSLIDSWVTLSEYSDHTDDAPTMSALKNPKKGHFTRVSSMNDDIQAGMNPISSSVGLSLLWHPNMEIILVYYQQSNNELHRHKPTCLALN